MSEKHISDLPPATLGHSLTVDTGQRVRALRARRGMSRKVLAQASEVSERYLAQLEKGSANISLVLLERIAQALSVHISELLPSKHATEQSHEPFYSFVAALTLEEQQAALALLQQHFAPQAAKTHGVALIGLRGAGKTTLGQALAARFGVPFVRLQERIVALAGMPMSELISLTGQSNYRRLERQALEEVLSDAQPCVLEVGGSLVSEAETFQRLRQRFHTVWIRAQAEEHMQRVIAQGDMRPMADNEQAMDDLRSILKARENDYQLADAQWLTSEQSVDESLEALAQQCECYLNPTEG